MKALIFVTIISAALSCSKSNSLQRLEYFAFGTAYGRCAANCANFFMVKDEKVYADDMSRFNNNQELVFKSTPMSAEKYLLAKQLLESFPDVLKNNPNKTVGCPDCHDQGRVYIEYKINGEKKFWNIDPEPSAQPVEIRDYIQKLRSTVTDLER
ncbi:MAG TPA: hypothetical protein VF610_07975 [Segetibacter sp.]|jgi:hypothetical protein